MIGITHAFIECSDSFKFSQNKESVMTELYQQKIIGEPSFDEEQWMKILFLISDTQEWLNDLQRQIIYQVLFRDKRKIFRKTFYLPATSLAHILERHYYKIRRYPYTSKFTNSNERNSFLHQRCIRRAPRAC